MYFKTKYFVVSLKSLIFLFLLINLGVLGFFANAEMKYITIFLYIISALKIGFLIYGIYWIIKKIF